MANQKARRGAPARLSGIQQIPESGFVPTEPEPDAESGAQVAAQVREVFTFGYGPDRVEVPAFVGGCVSHLGNQFSFTHAAAGCPVFSTPVGTGDVLSVTPVLCDSAASSRDVLTRVASRLRYPARRVRCFGAMPP